MYGYNAEPPIVPIYTVLPYCVIILFASERDLSYLLRTPRGKYSSCVSRACTARTRTRTFQTHVKSTVMYIRHPRSPPLRIRARSGVAMNMGSLRLFLKAISGFSRKFYTHENNPLYGIPFQLLVICTIVLEAETNHSII